jgi:23S rRNA (uracil1939-C5)-methyltransferase
VAAPRIVYVSCNPSTMAPNVAQLQEFGYRLERVTPVDMFPHTPHVECVGLLTLQPRQAAE